MSETIKPDVAAICERLNELNNHDGYRFIVVANQLYLREQDGCSLDIGVYGNAVRIDNPFAVLGAMESLDDEGRKYAMPFVVFR